MVHYLGVRLSLADQLTPHHQAEVHYQPHLIYAQRVLQSVLPSPGCASAPADFEIVVLLASCSYLDRTVGSVDRQQIGLRDCYSAAAHVGASAHQDAAEECPLAYMGLDRLPEEAQRTPDHAIAAFWC